MLEFNEAGLLVPPSIIASTLEEFRNYFAIESAGDVRNKLFENYTAYVEELKKISGIEKLKQLIDGSFVTKKENPQDIDLVVFIDYDVFEDNSSKLKKFVYPDSVIAYGLDCYIVKVYPETHKLYFAYKADMAYWISQFDKTKPGKRNKRTPKGFLEIIV